MPQGDEVLKTVIKKLTLNEEFISTVLGGLVVLSVVFIIFSYFKTLSRPKITHQAASTVNAEVALSPTPSTQEHIVVEDESLAQIASRYYGSSDSWQVIATANEISNPDSIVPGMKLVLPEIGEVAGTASPGELLTALSIEAINENTYVVEEGDTLWKISERAYGTGEKWPQIAEANPLPYPDYLPAGMKLTIPR